MNEANLHKIHIGHFEKSVWFIQKITTWAYFYILKKIVSHSDTLIVGLFLAFCLMLTDGDSPSFSLAHTHTRTHTHTLTISSFLHPYTRTKTYSNSHSPVLKSEKNIPTILSSFKSDQNTKNHFWFAFLKSIIPCWTGHTGLGKGSRLRCPLKKYVHCAVIET